VAGLVAAAPAAAENMPADNSRQVYVTNILSNNVSTFDTVAGGGLSPRAGLTEADGAPRTIVVTPDGRYAYTANGRNPVTGEVFNSVSAYRIDESGGLVSLGDPVTANVDPDALAVAPNGRTLYVVNRGTNTLLIFGIGTDGRLSQRGDPIPTGAEFARGVAMTPNGRFLFVSHGNPLAENQDFLTQFSVHDDGTLSAPGVPVPIGSAGGAMGVTPDGRFLYVPCSASGQVFGFRIEPDGRLLRVPGPVATAPDDPIAASVTPDGKYVYVTNGGLVASPSRTVSAYRILGNGVLEHIDEFTAGFTPVASTPTPDGRYLYVSNINPIPGTETWHVSAFEIGADGRLREVAGSPFPTGGRQPAYQSIVIRPNQGPIAAFTAAPGTPTAFDATASVDPDGRIARYDWDFGDGTVLRDGGPTPVHEYRYPGTYRVRLTVTDNENCSTLFVYYGTSALCDGSPAASVTRRVTV
jgi:DNA-binding beta-propeller fold protein YncE